MTNSIPRWDALDNVNVTKRHKNCTNEKTSNKWLKVSSA